MGLVADTVMVLDWVCEGSELGARTRGPQDLLSTNVTFRFEGSGSVRLLGGSQ